MVVCLVAGCGGRGGGAQVVRPAPQSVPRPVTSAPVASPDESERADIDALEAFYGGYFRGSLANAPFSLVNLDRAYANIYNSSGAVAAGRPGNGATIGFIDTGLDAPHPAFAGKSVSATYLQGTYEGSDLRDASHGTRVASVAAGVRRFWLLGDSLVTSEGVAPGADIRMFAVPLGSGSPVVAAPTESQLLGGGIDDAEPFVEALKPSLSVDVLNMSFGIRSNVEHYTESALRAGLGKTIEALSQAGRSEKAILVWAGGNENGLLCVDGSPGCESSGFFDGGSPGLLSGLHAKISELQGHSVVVVATRPDGRIADFSNKCGIAADWCIAAPGESIWVAFSYERSDGSVSRLLSLRDGTSFSAPIVAGGLALMKQQFRGHLSNVQLLERMFATADKTGIYERAGENAGGAIYGQGLLDLGAATEPVRTVGTDASGAGFVNEESVRRFVPLSGTGIETAGAFGDGIARAFAGREIAGFDSLGAPFWYPLEGFAVKTEISAVRRQLLEFVDFSTGGKTAGKGGVSATGGGVSAPLFTDENGRGKGFGAGGGGRISPVYVSMARGGIKESGRLNKSGHLSFVENPVSFGVESDNFAVSAFASDEREERGARGAVVSYRMSNLPFSFRSGYISESNSALGATAEGAFGGVSARAAFASVGWDYGFGDWQIVADAEMGIAAPETGYGLISGVSRLKTSSFSAGVIRRFSGGSAVRVSVSSPLRVESGRMGFSIPTGRTPEGAILREAVTANLEPTGRQMDFSAQVVAQTRMGRVSIGGVASREPGHDENADTALSLLAGYVMDF